MPKKSVSNSHKTKTWLPCDFSAVNLTIVTSGVPIMQVARGALTASQTNSLNSVSHSKQQQGA